MEDANGDAPSRWSAAVPAADRAKVATESTAQDVTEGGHGKRQPPQESVLRGLLLDNFDVIRSTDGRVFGVPHETPGRALLHAPTDSRLMRTVAMLFDESNGRWPSTTAIAAVSAYVTALADDAPATDVPLRCYWSRQDRALYLDTVDTYGTVLRVDADGVRPSVPPVPFRRSVQSAPLPWSTEVGSAADLDPLWDVVSISDPSDRTVVLALLISVWMTGTSQPVVLLTGPQDAGKTSAGRFLLSLVDPSTAERGKALPVDEREWKAAAAGSRAILVDNLSGLTSAASDMLCRVATGGEASSRAMYTDDALHVTNLHVPVWLTSISTGILRGDLASRLVRVELDALTDSTRLAESDLHDAQDAVRPQVTRGLLWLGSQVLARWDRTDRRNLGHRMGDFTTVVRVLDRMFGTSGEARLADDAVTLNADVVDSTPVAQAILDTLDPKRDPVGVRHDPMPDRITYPALLDRLHSTPTGRRAEHDRTWPRTPKVLSEAIQRVEPALLSAHGIRVDRWRSHGTRYLRIAKVADGDAGAAS